MADAFRALNFVIFYVYTVILSNETCDIFLVNFSFCSCTNFYFYLLILDEKDHVLILRVPYAK